MPYNHTPGPWEIDGFDITSVIVKEGNYWKHVARCDYGYSKPESNFEVNKANAKLIAASPDLLHSLTECLQGVKELYSQHQDGWQIVIQKAEEAIKKATHE